MEQFISIKSSYYESCTKWIRCERGADFMNKPDWWTSKLHQYWYVLWQWKRLEYLDLIHRLFYTLVISDNNVLKAPFLRLDGGPIVLVSAWSSTGAQVVDKWIFPTVGNWFSFSGRKSVAFPSIMLGIPTLDQNRHVDWTVD